MSVKGLIKRMERARKGSRLLDADFAVAIGAAPTGPGWWRSKTPKWKWLHSAMDLGSTGWVPLKYSTSIDAIRTAIPEPFRHCWYVSEDPDGSCWADIGHGAGRECFGHTPELAFGIALLKVIDELRS